MGEGDLNSSLLLKLPHKLEKRVKTRELSLPKTAALSERIQAAAVRRSSLLERRIERARKLGDATQVQQRRFKEKIRACVREAARLGRERRARGRREKDLEELRMKLKRKERSVEVDAGVKDFLHHLQNNGSSFLQQLEQHLKDPKKQSEAAQELDSKDPVADQVRFQKFEESSRIVKQPALINSTKKLLARISKEGVDVRTFLSAFMIILHPEIIMSNSKDSSMEDSLRSEAVKVVQAFLTIVHGGVVVSLQKETVKEFEDCWRGYAACFSSWKKRDALALESDLIKMACDLTVSVLKKCGPDFRAPRVQASPDLQAIVQQLGKDTKLLKSKVKSLTGGEGVKKFEETIRLCKVEFEINLLEENAKRQQYEIDDEKGHQSRCEEADLSADRQNDEQVGESTDASSGDRQAYSGVDLDHQKESSIIDDWKTRVVHELLHDPHYELLPINSFVSSEDFGVVSVEQFEHSFENIIDISSVVKEDVEKAFWDVLMGDLTAASFKSLVALLRELQGGISRICNVDVHREHDATKHIEAFEDQPDAERFLAVSTKMFDSLCQLGAPVREESAKAAFSKFTTQLQGASDLSAFPKDTCQLVKFLYTLYEVLNADIVNSQVRALRSLYQGHAAIDYLAERFQEKYAPRDGDKAKSAKHLLPKTDVCLKETRKWIEDTSAQLEIVSETEGEDSSVLPFEMKSGIGDPTLQVSSALMMKSKEKKNSIADSKRIPKPRKDLISSFILRTMAQDTPALLSDLPEILEMDRKRLVNMQNTFQRLVVLSASCILLHQLLARQRTEDIEKLKDVFSKRVNALLLHSETKLSHLSSELFSLLRQQGCDTAITTSEESISNLLNKLLDEESVAYKQLKKSVQKAVFISLIARQANGTAKASIVKQLKKSGAAVLYDKVIEAADKVESIAVIACKIHEKTLSDLSF